MSHFPRVGASTGRVFFRYALLQLPGQVLVFAGVVFAVRRGWLGWGWGAAGIAFWVAKDLALFPWLRSAYEPGDHDPSSALRGRLGRARDALEPEGYVALGGELWRAERATDSPPVASGDPIRVRDIHGLKLIVERVSHENQEEKA